MLCEKNKIFDKELTKLTALLMDSDLSTLATTLFYHLYLPPPSSSSCTAGEQESDQES